MVTSYGKIFANFVLDIMFTSNRFIHCVIKDNVKTYLDWGPFFMAI